MLISTEDGMIVLIGAIILCCSTRTRNWCTCLLYIILSLFDGFNCLLETGKVLIFHTKYSGLALLAKFLTMIRLPFYLISVYYTFLAYREMKALSVDYQEGRIPLNNREDQPFYGTGHRLN